MNWFTPNRKGSVTGRPRSLRSPKKVMTSDSLVDGIRGKFRPHVHSAQVPNFLDMLNISHLSLYILDIFILSFSLFLKSDHSRSECEEDRLQPEITQHQAHVRSVFLLLCCYYYYYQYYYCDGVRSNVWFILQ